MTTLPVYCNNCGEDSTIEVTENFSRKDLECPICDSKIPMPKLHVHCKDCGEDSTIETEKDFIPKNSKCPICDSINLIED